LNSIIVPFRWTRLQRLYAKLQQRKVCDRALGFVEGLNNKIRVFQRRAYGLRDEEYLKLKILTSGLPEL
jgi:hypothetical protein